MVGDGSSAVAVATDREAITPAVAGAIAAGRVAVPRKKAEDAKVGKGPQPSQQVAGSDQVHNLGGGPAADDWGHWSGAGAVGQNASTIGEADK